MYKHDKGVGFTLLNLTHENELIWYHYIFMGCSEKRGGGWAQTGLRFCFVVRLQDL